MSRPDRRQPVRTCIGCRVRGDKSEFLRLVVVDGALVIDVPMTRPGRGAYLHRSADCLGKALRRRAFGRALRAAVDIDQAGDVLARHLG